MKTLAFVASILAFAAACGSSDESPGTTGSPGGGGGAVNAGGSSGTGGIAAGAGGVSAGGASGAGGIAAGAGGQTAGAGGQTAGAGGQTAGAGGQTAGAGGAQTGGTGGQTGVDAATDAKDSAAPTDGPSGDGAVASGLDGLRILMPCTPGAPKTENGDVCPTTAQVDKQSYSIAVGGDPTKTYDVQIRVRGVVETMTYSGGTLQTAISPHYYVGGTKVDGTFNIYSINVPDPKQVFYFNAATATSHTLFTVDYVVTISMKGGTTITAGVDGQNGLEITNKGNLSVAGLTGITQPYDGQFLQFDIVAVTAK